MTARDDAYCRWLSRYFFAPGHEPAVQPETNGHSTLVDLAQAVEEARSHLTIAQQTFEDAVTALRDAVEDVAA